ncbi:MAG: hypothetical protein ABIK09_02600 [Pseudomonadota bacterium]
MLRLLLLVALLGIVAWCVLVAPTRDPESVATPPPSLTQPMCDSLDQGVRNTVDQARDRAEHGLRRTGHRLEEAGTEANEWLSEKTDEVVKQF